MTIGNTHHAAEPYNFRGAQYNGSHPMYSAISQNLQRLSPQRWQGRHCQLLAVYSYRFLRKPQYGCYSRSHVQRIGLCRYIQVQKLHTAVGNAYEEGSMLSPEYQLLPKQPNNNDFFKNVDGIKFLNHQGGCGSTRQDAAILSKLLAAYANHPNVGGITMLSLGCQHLQVQQLMKDIQASIRLLISLCITFEQQAMQSEEKMIREAIYKTFMGLPN